MGLFTKTFPTSARDLHLPEAGAESSPPRNAGTLALPPNLDAQDAPLWLSQITPAQNLLGELNRMESLQALKSGEKFIQSGPPVPLRPSTLLDATRGGSGPMLGERLHANHLGSGTVVMATPTASQNKLWRRAMQDHLVTHVVNVGSDLETVLQDLIPRVALPLPRGLSTARTPSACRYWNVTASPKHAIAPSTMLKVFRELAAAPPQSGSKVAFQSPAGDDRSAVFAAGWEIYQDISRRCNNGRRLSDSAVADVVQEAVVKMKTNRSTHLLSQAGHVASLLALALQVRDSLRLREAPQPSKRRELDVPQPARSAPRTQAGTANSAPGTAEISQGRAETPSCKAARDICDKIRQAHSSAQQDFAPIKASTGRLRRFRMDRLLQPDPILKGLPGARLPGVWASSGTLILEPTGPAHALALAVACLQHNMAAVIDVGGRSDPVGGPAIARGTRTFEQDSAATFDWETAEFPLDDPLRSTSIGMQVSARVRGQPVLRDVSREPRYMQPKDISPTRRPLEWVRAPLSEGKAVPPQELLAIGALMERFRSDGAGTPVVVQCPAGDWRGAMAAAADLLYSRFQEGRLTPDSRRETVQDIWTQMCTHYSMDLADEPEQLASLMDMADLLVAQSKRSFRW